VVTLNLYQERVVEERDQLKERIEKLEAFRKGELYARLDSDERDRLARQWGLMHELLDVLDERILAFRS
jgi:uncharacterized protein YktB (UPF0637 family)